MNSWLEQQRKETIPPLNQLLWYGCKFKDGAIYDIDNSYIGFHRACKKYEVDLSIYDAAMTMIIK